MKQGGGFTIRGWGGLVLAGRDSEDPGVWTLLATHLEMPGDPLLSDEVSGLLRSTSFAQNVEVPDGSAMAAQTQFKACTRARHSQSRPITPHHAASPDPEQLAH